MKDGDVLLLYRVPQDAPCGAVQSSQPDITSGVIGSSEGGVQRGAVAAEREDGEDEAATSSASSSANNVGAAFAALSEDRRRRLIQEATTLREALLSRPEEIGILQGKNTLLAEALVTGTFFYCA